MDESVCWSGEGDDGADGSWMLPSGNDVSSSDWIILSMVVDAEYVSVVMVPLTSFWMEGMMSL